MAMPDRWWAGNTQEIYWLEITDRPDIGQDLNAPKVDEGGREYWGYSFVYEAHDGDIVFHYSKPESAIVGISQISGAAWSDSVVWAARGTYARARDIKPYIREGWRRGLVNFSEMTSPVTLDDLREIQPNLTQITDEVRRLGPAYFPFELSEKRPLRPMQAYLSKLPLKVVEIVPALKAEAERLQTSAPAQRELREDEPADRYIIGTPYRYADEDTAVSVRDPFEVDPSLVERAIYGHAHTQNLLAQLLEQSGLLPRSPNLGEPNYDLLWETASLVNVVEVKSLTSENEEKQLRLGLGQVLRYQHRLSRGGRRVRAILLVEREPSDITWIDLCNGLGVTIAWPETIDLLLRQD